MSLIDLFKDFHKQAIVNEYPASARALYFTLLGDFNAAFFPEHRIYSQRELSRLTGLSQPTIHRSLKFLAQHKHITVHMSKNRTVIRLCNSESVVNQSRINRESPETNSIIRVREDVKDVKTKTLGGTRTRELSEVWVAEMHRPLGASERYELAELEEIHGYDKVKSAIEQAKKSRYYPTFDDMKEKLLKGGEKVETADTYTNITRTGNEPWLNY